MRTGPGVPARLEPGSHRSPDDGVCIIELASVIGGEAFSDRPRCVCPVVAAFLRGWNDRAGYFDRQRLHPYASKVVGTGGYRRISRIRRDLCLSSAGADLDRGQLGRFAETVRMRVLIAWAVGVWPAIRLKEGAGSYAARACFARGGSEEAFTLLDRLLEAGTDPAAEPPASPPDDSVPAELERLMPADGTRNNGNGDGNGYHRDELGLRATIIARERARAARSPAARASGSAPAADGDRPRDARAPQPGVDSAP